MSLAATSFSIATRTIFLEAERSWMAAVGAPAVLKAASMLPSLRLEADSAKEISGRAASSVKVAERSGKLLEELVPAIRKTADLVQEVAAASSEQSSGVAQINKAMSQVDQVTQRNASGSEELASTAEEMASQAEALQQLVSFFRLNGMEDIRRQRDVRAPQASKSHTPR